MMTVTGLIYTASNSEHIDGMNGTCRACGEVGQGQLFNKWVKDTFTDHDKLFAGEIVCNACLFCFDDHNEPLTKLLGKDKPQRMRNYSHIVLGGEWFALSKGDKTKIYELLLQSPEVAVIAESGQKHLIFKARPNIWHLEGINILPFPERLRLLYESASRLYNLQITKAEIESGNYSQRTFMQNGIEKIIELDEPLKPHRGSLQLKIAVYLMQKEKENESTI